MVRTIVLATLVIGASACTTYLVGKKATADGSVMCTHTNDGSGTTDPRLVRIPARDYPDYATSTGRPVWASPESYPRYVGYDRNASEYYPENCLSVSTCGAFQPIGYIPQVQHTFAYFETTYGVMNEMQVGIGESTCSGVFVARSVDQGE
jgi:dipeptidase